MKRRKYLTLVITVALLSIYTQSLYAYLDPGTGSMLLAALIGIISTLLFTMKSLWYKIIVFLHAKLDTVWQRFRSKLAPVQVEQTNVSDTISDTSVHTENSFSDIVCYSEGSQYWNTFAPIIEALHERQLHCYYLSSDEDDAGLAYQSPYVHTKYIGKGNKAYTYLNLLHAKICVLTTPNLDTLHIRRSKGVLHYTHIVHAPTDIHLYKLFAFDFYDSIMVSGPHQEKSLRYLEKVRGTRVKSIYNVGCPYMDMLAQKKLSAEVLPNNRPEKPTETYLETENHNINPTVLVAPTWGESSLLNLYGADLLRPLLEANYTVIVRPHPQSFVAEPQLIEDLTHAFAHCKNLHWDKNPDNFYSLSKADLLISDRSGIIFDFAFIFEKPIIVSESESVLLGMEGNDIPWQAWELEILPNIATPIRREMLDSISDIIDQKIDKNTDRKLAGAQNTTQVATLREQYLYNLNASGERAVDTLAEILAELDSADSKEYHHNNSK